jgi:hypothetical protein
MALRLAQMFDVSNSFTPIRTSLYLKRIGTNIAGYYLLDAGDVPIDATNFNSLAQSGNKIVIDDRTAGYTNNGYMRVQFVSGSNWPTIFYTVQTTTPAKFYLYLRGWSSTGTFKASILVNDVVVNIVNSVAVAAWQWFPTNFVLPDNKEHILGIRLEENDNLLDKVEIKSLAVSPVGTGTAINLSPFVTLHLQVYDLENLEPHNPLFIYDWKTTVYEVHIDDWYNFFIRSLDGSNLSFDESYALVFSASGGSKDNYVIWELVDNNEYLLLPSAIKV